MRKQIIGALICAGAALSAQAEGYQINSLSARQIGMGHTGIALPLGSESMFFNPAGMAFSEKTLGISASVTGISSYCTADVEGVKYKTDNKIATPMIIGAEFKIYDNLKGGVAFYTPYGSSINWGDNWPGAILNQNVSLKTFTLQPTLAWAITPNLSIGAGLMLSWGNVDLNKGLVSPATTDKAISALKKLGMLPAETPAFGSTTPASVNLHGTADLVAGFNVGAMYKINSQWTVGANFRSKMEMRVKSGRAQVSYANKTAEALLDESLGLINEANFKAKMPCPWVLGFGVSYKPIEALTIAADARLTGWHAYKRLDIEFLAEQLTAYNQNIQKNYKNSWTYSVGAQYAVTRRFDARLGMMVDTTPVNIDYYNPETPGMTKIEPTLGFSFRPIDQLSIDFGMMFVAGCGKDNASCRYPDLLGASMIKQLEGAGLPGSVISAMGFEAEGTFKANYSLHAFIPSLGISYSF